MLSKCASTQNTLRDAVLKAVKTGNLLEHQTDITRGPPKFYKTHLSDLPDRQCAWGMFGMSWTMREPLEIDSVTRGMKHDARAHLLDPQNPVVPPCVRDLEIPPPRHTPGRCWSRYRPDKLQKSWDKSNFPTFGAMVAAWEEKGFPPHEEAAKLIEQHIAGCGKYGSFNLLRMIYIALGMRMGGDCFLPMPALKAKYDTLRKFAKIVSVPDFNSLDPSFDFDAGQIAYLVCKTLDSVLKEIDPPSYEVSAVMYLKLKVGDSIPTEWDAGPAKIVKVLPNGDLECKWPDC